MPLKGFGYPDFQPTARGYLPIKENTDAISANLRTLLSIYKGERVMMPDYGSGLDKLLFAPITENLFGEIRAEVVSLIDRWEPRIAVEEIYVGYPTEHIAPQEINNDHVVVIKISYSPKYDLDARAVVQVLLPSA